MGVSDPEIQKKVFGLRWQHEIEKARLATMETTRPSFPTLSSMQTEKSWPKSSMSVEAWLQQ